MWLDGLDSPSYGPASEMTQIMQHTICHALKEALKTKVRLASSSLAMSDAMFAQYERGSAGFVRHSDNSNPLTDPRTVSAVYYLNTIHPQHGGQLLLHRKDEDIDYDDNDSDDNQQQIVRVSPKSDRLVLFWSHMDHEVTPFNHDAPEPRRALSFWYLKDVRMTREHRSSSNSDSRSIGNEDGDDSAANYSPLREFIKELPA
mmetsp:Transcript_35717/g.69367  ORF Transcript_35717/g.69367 Transcript_35717/m.69367 type:complete len:202 (+) Transcript_35717:212-817(+)